MCALVSNAALEHGSKRVMFFRPNTWRISHLGKSIMCTSFRKPRHVNWSCAGVTPKTIKMKGNIKIMNDIPFKNTQEAIVFGQSMSEEMKDKMIRGQKQWHNISNEAVKKDDWDTASVASFNSQLCREAVEAFNGTLKLIEDWN